MYDNSFKPNRGDMGSGGSFGNPMYTQICNQGTYHPETGRKIRRRRERQERKELKRINKIMERKLNK